MADKKVIKKEKEVKQEGIVVVEDAIIPEVKDEVKIEATVDNRPSKKCVVKVKKYTRLYIGEWFTFEPNKIYRVDEEVKLKLQGADLLLPV